MTTPSPAPHGLLLIDKPTGPTSHGVVAAVRRALGTRKVGHAGTLDPMASGLMLVGVGVATRLLTFAVGADKHYSATIRLGETTTTEDAEGDTVEIASPEALEALDARAIEEAMAPLRGDLDQVPSSVSAIKIDGVRSYRRVRAGEEVELPSRPVHIASFTASADPVHAAAVDGSARLDLEVEIDCSSGTYVRALARDLGAALGVGAHLTRLRRTRVGGFELDEAAALDDGALRERLLTPAAAARRLLPVVELSATEAEDLGHGRAIRRGAVADAPERAAAIAPDGRLIGVVEPRDGALRAVMNLPQEAAS